ncbi:MAG: helix-turn-helix transcriptional regulator [Patescibacteria group bacterium]|uniref:Helix-turn-helix domain-containing protein n=1 Tax=candidate division WWE3 bacterium TaxID=2053526 RepID=A0A955ECU0_UNCKA|nr:helix-turn-helix domain-containing protein [candidate division WWE3 bacterium]
MYNRLVMQLGNQIKIIRETNKLSQRRFGEKIGVSGKTISAYETGKCIPSTKIIEAITITYGVSFARLTNTDKSEIEKNLAAIESTISEIKSILVAIN